MPFRPTSLCFEIEVIAEPKTLKFGKSITRIAYSVECQDMSSEKFEVAAAQRMSTGEKIDNRWSLRKDEIAHKKLGKSLPSVRFFELEFNGPGLSAALAEKESAKKDKSQLDLYRSILARDQIRLDIKIGEERREYLTLELGYHVVEAANSKCS